MLFKIKTFIAASVLSVSVGANVQAAVLTAGTSGFSMEPEKLAVLDLEKWNTISSKMVSSDLYPMAGQVNQKKGNDSHLFWVKTNKLKSAAPVTMAGHLIDDDVDFGMITPTAAVPNNQIGMAESGQEQVQAPDSGKETTDQIQQPSEEPESSLPIAEETDENSGEAVTADNQKAETAANEPPVKELTVKATAYTAYCEGCSGITATGVDIKSNPHEKVIAVDPNVIPLGSKVYVEGYGEAIAADTGGAIKGNRIDVFIPSEQDALEWGKKEVTLQIIN
ncbi:3D domain-containing protein [Neobacillus muris]|uniref:3D domain-containing protein n=1 Tax=Neobacillus muris TaxID=2941334 RepID=UPI0024087D5A|nr:3D domain-containing protein [Neobacillus muris]